MKTQMTVSVTRQDALKLGSAIRAIAGKYMLAFQHSGDRSEIASISAILVEELEEEGNRIVKLADSLSNRNSESIEVRLSTVTILIANLQEKKILLIPPFPKSLETALIEGVAAIQRDILSQRAAEQRRQDGVN